MTEKRNDFSVNIDGCKCTLSTSGHWRLVVENEGDRLTASATGGLGEWDGVPPEDIGSIQNVKLRQLAENTSPGEITRIITCAISGKVEKASKVESSKK